MPAQPPPSIDAFRKRGLEPLKLAALVAILYAGFSSIYIVYSSWLAAHLGHTPREIRMVETGKGILFVLITAALLSAIIFHWSRRARRQEELLVSMERRSLAASYNATLAHDLNNLLMTFNGLLGEMRDLEGANTFLRGTREQLERGIESLGGLSRRLAAAAANRESDRISPVDLRDTLSRAAALARKHPDLLGRTLTLPEVPALTLTLDQDLLVHAFINLVINAAQAIPRGGHIEVRVLPSGDTVYLEVHDDGPGVPTDIAGRIFEAGFTTKLQGTGLGLLSARHFAETSGGCIQLLRSPLGGALFRISIPHR
jgi:signal transduction histidine kinase